MAVIDLALNALLPTLIILHLFVAPYTKVEESFNIQATHDLIHFAPLTPLAEQSFDHFTFPGAVPRTFVGASLLALLSKPWLYFLGPQYDVFYTQLVVRGILGLLNAGALLRYKYRLEKAFGKDVGRWWTLFVGSGFHVVFYASRTLPNMFAFGLTTLAFAECLPVGGRADKSLRGRRQRIKNMIYLFVVAGVIFRSEIALLLFTQLAYMMLQSWMSVETIMIAGIKSAAFALAISLPIDSYLWRYWWPPMWPELAGFYYNAVLGKSSDWGTSPYSEYFTSLLPKLLLNPLIALLIPLSLLLQATKQHTKNLTIPSIMFIAIYSLQPHKEARFIIYVVPPLVAAASLSASYIWTRRSKSLLYRMGSLVLVASTLGSFAVSSVMLLISSLNYPGGEALAQLHSIMNVQPIQHAFFPGYDGPLEVNIHMDVLSCMTGVTRFQQYPSLNVSNAELPQVGGRPTTIAYDKTEDETILADPVFWSNFDYALMEEPGRAIGAWEIVGTVWAYAGIEILRPGQSTTAVEKLGAIYAANNLTKDGEAMDSDNVREAAETMQIPTPVQSAINFETLKKRVMEGNLGRFKIYTLLRDTVRLLTGGWWVGPRMEPKIRILERAKE